MPRLILVFAGHIDILLVLSWGGSYAFVCQFVSYWLVSSHFDWQIATVSCIMEEDLLIQRQAAYFIYSIITKMTNLFNTIYLETGMVYMNWAASSEFGAYRLCEQRRFRRACASAQSRQNLRCSLIQALSQEEPSDRKPDPWPLWMAGHAQLKVVMTECSKPQIRLTRPNY